MNQSFGKRYITDQKIFDLPNGVLYSGEDLSLEREVILFMTKRFEGPIGDEYIRRLKQASAFNHDGFQHILDTSFEGNQIIIALKPRLGRPLMASAGVSFSLYQVVEQTAELGLAMLDALEERMNDFSVAADNLWLSENGHLSVINNWEAGNVRSIGARGLCNLIRQMIGGSLQLAEANEESLAAYFAQIEAPKGQKELLRGLINLLSRVYHGQASLPVLVFGLQELKKTHVSQAEILHKPIVTVQDVDNSKKTDTIKDLAVQEAAAAKNLDDETPKAADKTSRKLWVILGIIWVILAAVALWLTIKSHHNHGDLLTPSPSVAATLMPTQSNVPMATIQNDGEANSIQNGNGTEVTVPDLTGMKQADAVKLVLSLGLHYVYFLAVDTHPAGTVFKQDIDPGTMVAQGDQIQFWVSKDNG